SPLKQSSPGRRSPRCFCRAFRAPRRVRMRPWSCSRSRSPRQKTVDPLHVLIIEDDQDLLTLLTLSAAARHYRTRAVPTPSGATAAIAGTVFDAAVVDLTLGADSGLDAIRAIKAHAPDTEIIVISGSNSLAAAIASYELKAFAFVPKPFDVDQLFSTIARAMEHRQVIAANRRLVWEQRLVNEIGDE